MPRRREVPKRDILPDPKFGNVEVSKFVNTIMMSGKKSVAERIVYGAFDIIIAKGGKDPIEVFGLAITMSSLWLKLRAVESVAPTTKFLLMCVPAVAWRWQCAGCVSRHASVRKSQWISVWLPKCLRLPKIAVVLSRSVMKCTVWLMQTRRLRISGSSLFSAGSDEIAAGFSSLFVKVYYCGTQNSYRALSQHRHQCAY